MFIDKDTKKRVNIYSPYKGYSKLDTPEIRESAGVIEIQEPALPVGYIEKFWYKTEQDTAPYVIYTKKSDEQIAQIKLSEIPVLSPWQMRKSLNAAGIREAVELVVKNSTDQEVKDAWEFATEFRRDNPLVDGVATLLGKTSEEVDQLFINGATL